MATRSIRTHQPEVSCDMCGRRLLRGERPNVFLAAGDSRTVCELCVPRAAGEGWTRASDAPPAGGAVAPRPRRGRSLLGRLRQRQDRLQEPSRASLAPQQADPADALWPGGSQAWEPPPRDRDEQEWAYAGAPLATEEQAPLDADHAADVSITPAEGPDAVLRQALQIFNASECAARVAGIARALGEPQVTVREQPGAEDRVRVVVAWELCWYRYEVDLRERPATIALVDDGTELEQLDPEDALGNAKADERGELSLL
jgi:hypothetical protein